MLILYCYEKLLIVIALASACLFANAQSKTLGGRINGLLGFGIEVEYEHYVANENFLNFGADLLFGNGFGMAVTGVYDFTIGHAGAFDFYAGPGVSVIFFAGEGGFFAPGIVGNIGAQWNIGEHFALSLDYRPGIHCQIGSQWLHSAYNVGLGIKYRW